MNSKNFNRIGGAVSLGVQHKDFIIQAGILFLGNDIERQDICWKGSFLYHPYKSRFLFGLSYAPLTNAGIVISHSLKYIIIKQNPLY